MSELNVAICLEAHWQTFRRMNGLGDGLMHRQKFVRLFNQQADAWVKEQERQRILVVTH